MHRKEKSIQGLRALAVLLVIANHLLVWPSGGFVGVDVFFVISGFIITESLLRIHRSDGRISLADFYRRRVKRILPAAATVLLVTVAVAIFLFTAVRSASVIKDAIWSALFAANWRFAHIGTDYMHANGPVSPLQHFWSLSVEEQFYLVWPLVVVVVLGFRRLSISRRKSILISVGAAIAIVSFTWSIRETATQPPAAYFSTFSRAWELGVGSLLGVFSGQLGRIPRWTRSWLVWIGLSVIGLSAALLNSNSSFPGPLAIFPVLGSALVIIAGTGTAQPKIAVLTNRFSVYIGEILYSLYLWHFPVFIILGLFLSPGHRLSASAIALTGALAVLSFHLVENPIRNSSWLTRSRIPRPMKRVPLLVWISPVAIIVLVCATVVYRPSSSTASVATPVSNLAAAGAQQQSAIVQALAAKTWPRLSPALNKLTASAKAPEWVDDGCLAGEEKADPDPIKNVARCTFGSIHSPVSKVAVIIGDSTAISYAPAIRASLEPRGYEVRIMTMAECPAIDISVMTQTGASYPACDRFREKVYALLAAVHPELIIATSSEDSAGRLAGHPKSAGTVWAEAVGKTLSRLVPLTQRLVILDPPPFGQTPSSCATRNGSPLQCMVRPDAPYLAMSRAVDEAGVPGVTHIKVLSWFCAANLQCPAFIGGTPVFVDAAHLTGTMSKSLGPLLSESLFPKPIS